MCVLPHTAEQCENEPQNDHTMELNVNFLLTTTVCDAEYPSI